MGQLSTVENLERWRDGLDRGRMIPVAACQAVISEIEVWDTPCGIGIAKASARILIGTYPSRQVNDPEIYSKAIVSVLAEYPAEVCRDAVDRVTRELKFLPTRNEVLTMLSKVRAETTRYIFRAREVLKAHERRQEALDYERQRKQNPVTDEQVAEIKRRAWA